MRRKKIKIIILVALLAIISFFLLFSDIIGGKKNKEIYQISVIIRGKDKENWSTMKQGIDQAALEMNANISFINLAEENNCEEQKKILKTEKENGADVILISPSDYEEMVVPIEEISNEIPVVQIESRINTKDKIPYISCDNYELGVKLAEDVIARGNTSGEIAILRSSFESSSIKERRNGFVDTIKNTKNTYQYLDFSLEDKSGMDRMEEILKNNIYDSIVSFDSPDLEVMGSIKKNISKSMIINSELYGVGSTSKIIALIEEKIIVSIAVQNEFNVGYLGLKAAIDMKNNRKIVDNIIEYRIITERNLYSDENQRFLFPFIR